jgi:hypothetical protein
MRVTSVVIGTHRTAEKNETVISVERRRGVWFAIKVHIANAEPVALEERIEGSEHLERHVLTHQNSLHGHLIGTKTAEIERTPPARAVFQQGSDWI